MDIGRIHIGIREFSVCVWGAVAGTVLPRIAPNGIHGDEGYAVGALVATGLGVVSSWLPRGHGGPPPEVPEGIPPQRGQIADPGRVVGHVAPLANLMAALANHTDTRAIVSGGLGLGKTMLTEKAASSLPVRNLYGDRVFEARCTNAPNAASVWACVRDAVWGSGASSLHDASEICCELARLPSVLILDGLDLAITEDRAATLDVLTRLTDLVGGRAEQLAVVVTVRDLPAELGEWAEYHLDPLSDQESLALFDHAAKWQHLTNKKAIQLVSRMDGVPLAIVLLARVVNVEGLHKTLHWYQQRGTDILEDPDPSHRTPPWQVVIEAALFTDVVGERGRHLAAVLAEQSSGLGRSLLAPHGLWLDRVAAQALAHLGLCQYDHDRLWCLAPIQEHIVRHHPLTDAQRTEVGAEALEILTVVATSAQEVGEHRVRRGRLSGVGHLMEWLGSGSQNDDAVIQLGLASWPGDFFLDARLAAICRAEPDDTRFAQMAAELMDIEFRRSCYEASAGWAKRLVSKARDEVDTARALRCLAEVAWKTGDGVGAVAGFASALSTSRRVDDRSGEAASLRGLAEASRLAGHGSEAVDGYTQALAICRDIRDRSGEAKALVGLATVARRNGDRGAVEGYTGALNVCRDIGDRFGESEAAYGLADIARRNGDNSRAIEGFMSILATCRSLGYRSEEARALAGLAAVARATDDESGAVDRFVGALTIYRDIGDRSGEAYVLLGLADVARGNGDYSGAVEHYRNVLEACRDVGDRSCETYALDGLANIERDAGNYSEAVDGYTKALAVSRDIGNRFGEADALFGLANVALRTGNTSGAVDRYTKALAVYRDIGNRFGEAHALGALAHVAMDTGNTSGAVDGYTKALAVYRDIGNRYGEADSLDGFGRASGRVDAQARAADLFSQLGQHEKAATIWQHLSNLVADHGLRLTYHQRAIAGLGAAGQLVQADELSKRGPLK